MVVLHIVTTLHLQVTSDLSRFKRANGVRNDFQSGLTEQTMSKIIKLPHYYHDNYRINTLHFNISNLFCNTSKIGRLFRYI